MSVLEIRNVKKRYKNKVVLNNISLNIKGTYGLLGPNGAGKTTLMKIIATLLPLEEGTITFGDISWENDQRVKPLIGYLPQYFSAYKTMKVYEVLHHFAILKGITNKERRISELDAVLENVNLYEQRNEKIKYLSGGMIRRVGIAQALLGNPKIVIVDEPTAGLDIQERVRFRNLLRKISANRTIIISSHIVEDLETTCDYVAMMNKGTILLEGSRQEVLQIVDGLVWEKEVNSRDLEQIPESQIISVKEAGDRYIVRMLSQESIKEAKRVHPTLEDAYLYMMKGDNH
ncbi:ABC transporter ATP-binding protein [Parageobacillus thermoglucosidasius]|uniref:ATP-binding cassette domain-containing protein n=1 Tax=Parageobacillus thermoglucosidasius TaxID=1426 RepID=UPI000F61C602|nr:ATP-binding cassette domain-containing protein [Parageobacillus thermoglucosidasius]GCD84375.1 ABC transporter ATP-binding protein [Parageobacillus thermoglucosidasius]